MNRSNHYPLIALFALFSLLLFPVACTSSAGDDGASADVGYRIDVEDDASSAPITEAAMTVANTTVHLSFEPFELEVRDGQGGLRTATPAGSDPGFSGIDLGRARSFDSRRYYDPKLEDNHGLGEGMEWFRPGRVTESSSGDDGVTFLVTTVGPEDEEGPQMEISLREGDHSVILTVTAPDDERWVHTSLSLAAGSDEAFFGLGEHFDRLDGRGLIREMQIQYEPDSESATNEVHVPIPFLLSSERYGLFVDDRYPGAFDLAATNEDVMRATFTSPSVTYHFFVDDDPLDLIETYTDIMGKPAHVPYWALAPMWWRNRHDDQAQVLSDAERARQFDIPSTVMWIDRPWQSYYHNWRFSEVQFPDPQAMMDRLAELGHRVLLHHSPQMNPPGQASGIVGPPDESEGLYDLYLENGWLVTYDTGEPFRMAWGGGNGAFIDYSHTDAIDHVQQMLTRVTDLGVIGTKMDWDEYLQPNLLQWRIPLVFANGETNMTMKSWYSALYHKAIIEGFDQAHGEPTFHLSRSGAPGDQQWNTCIWPGDLDSDFTEHTRGPSERQDEWNVGGLPAAIVANQSLGMAGYPCFGSDIGGYREGPPTQEVLKRWMAFGTFNTVMQLGGGGRTHLAWSEDAIYDEQALEVTRKYFRLRMELFPYIFHHMLLAERSGRPMVRSLWMAYPDDRTTRDHERDFLFGPDILVAPIFTADTTERELYLPQGQWIDLWTGERIDGNQVITREAPIELIPVYLRQGAIVPMADGDIDTLVDADEAGITSYQEVSHSRFLLVPGESLATLSLFNGVTVSSHREDTRITVDLTVAEPDPDVDERVAFNPDELTLHLMVDGILDGSPSSVELDGTAIDEDLDQQNCRPCWQFEQERQLIHLRLDEAGTVVIEE